jgi:hypothetical protein
MILPVGASLVTKESTTTKILVRAKPVRLGSLTHSEVKQSVKDVWKDGLGDPQTHVSDVQRANMETSLAVLTRNAAECVRLDDSEQEGQRPLSVRVSVLLAPSAKQDLHNAPSADLENTVWQGQAFAVTVQQADTVAMRSRAKTLRARLATVPPSS